MLVSSAMTFCSSIAFVMILLNMVLVIEIFSFSGVSGSLYLCLASSSFSWVWGKIWYTQCFTLNIKVWRLSWPGNSVLFAIWQPVGLWNLCASWWEKLSFSSSFYTAILRLFSICRSLSNSSLSSLHCNLLSLSCCSSLLRSVIMDFRSLSSLLVTCLCIATFSDCVLNNFSFPLQFFHFLTLRISPYRQWREEPFSCRPRMHCQSLGCL